MSGAGPALVHATAVSLAGRGVLLRGAPRSGKSALAFMLLRRAEALGWAARLVADDQVRLWPESGTLAMEAPATIRGLIEVSGVGILPEAADPPGARTALALLVDLAADPRSERLPDPALGLVGGVAVPRIVLPAREAALGAEIVLHLLARDLLPETQGREA